MLEKKRVPFGLSGNAFDTNVKDLVGFPHIPDSKCSIIRC